MYPQLNPLICSRDRAAHSTRHRSMLVACNNTGGDLPDVQTTASASTSTFPETPLSKPALFRLSLISGAIAGFAVDAILFPLDTLKTRLQLATTTAVVSSTTAAANPATWLIGLYTGFGPAVVASAPSAAAFFGTYDLAKRTLSEKFDPKYAPLLHMVAAACGDVAGSTVRSPFEVVKQRLQSGMYSSTKSAVTHILRNEGPMGFFTGYTSLVLRELPFDALQFPLYEYFKKEWTKAKYGAGKSVDVLQTWESCVCGSVAGGLSAAVTTPLDVVKTRLMTQAAENPKYLGLIHGLKTIAREEGPKTLLSGIVPRVVWISLGGAIFFGAYEASKKAITPMIRNSEFEKKRKV